MTISIYGLFHPNDLTVVRYVGKTASPLRARLMSHISEARSGSANHKCHWIRKLLSAGLIPVISLLEETEADAWQECERRLIAHHKSTITNGTEGGDGGRPLHSSGLGTTRVVGVSLYATDEAIAQSIGQGVTSRGVQLALRNFNAALKLLAETRSYVHRTHATWQEAYDNPEHEYYKNEWMLSSLQDADDLLRRIDDLTAATPSVGISGA